MTRIKLVGGFAHSDKGGQISIPPKEAFKISSVKNSFIEIPVMETRGRDSEGR